MLGSTSHVMMGINNKHCVVNLLLCGIMAIVSSNLHVNRTYADLVFRITAFVNVYVISLYISNIHLVLLLCGVKASSYLHCGPCLC